MNSEVNVRELSSEDVVQNHSEFIALLQQSYQISFREYQIDKSYFNKKVNDLRYFISQGQAIVFGAFSSSQLVGFIWCYFRMFLDEKRFHVNHFVVNDLYRGQGIGKCLLKKVENYAIQKGISTIDLMVTSQSRSVEFYRNNGFTIERYQMTKRLY